MCAFSMDNRLESLLWLGRQWVLRYLSWQLATKVLSTRNAPAEGGAQDAAQGALQRRPGGGWCVVSPCGEKAPSARLWRPSERMLSCRCRGGFPPPGEFPPTRAAGGPNSQPSHFAPLPLPLRCHRRVGFPLRRGVGSDTQGAASLDSNALAALNGSSTRWRERSVRVRWNG
jgi:hypothetical protein